MPQLPVLVVRGNVLMLIAGVLMVIGTVHVLTRCVFVHPCRHRATAP
jgi:hypothetical protein